MVKRHARGSVRRLARWTGVILGLSLIAILVAAGLAVNGVRRRIPGMKEEISRFERALSPEDLPEGWLDILLRVEDPAFREHSGIDLRSSGAGMTTITQALAKKYCFEEFRPGPLNKVKQSISALALDRYLTKEEQLILFLNVASLGPGRDGWIEGFPAAAREYYSKSFEDLTVREFTALVAMLVGPVKYHPVRGADALAGRVGRIERLLRGECEAAGLMDVYYEQCS